LFFLPVLSLPILNPIFSKEFPSAMLGLSPKRPAGLTSSPIFIFALRNVPVVKTTDLALIIWPFS